MTTITTLIPAYKKDYLPELLVGLHRQRFKDFAVILSDDSPGAEISDLLRQGPLRSLAAGLNLRIVRGPQNARHNHQQLLDLWNGSTPLVHFHLDDDVIYPDFYQAHVEAHVSGTYCASVSPRWLSQSDGRPALKLPVPRFVTDSPLHVVPCSAEQIFATTVPVCENWLGELSNMVLSSEGARCYPQPPTQDVSYYGLLDIGLLLEASRHQPVAFIRDHLSVFRQHPGQTTQNLQSHGGRVGFLVWIAYALVAWREQRITPEQTVQAIDIASRRCLQQFADDPTMGDYFVLVEQHSSSLEDFHAAFRDFWLRLLASQPGTRSARPTTAAADSSLLATA